MSKRSEEKGGPSMSPVHSANKWESATFDDDAKRQKFLRLMGGMKKQHTGRFVIGDTHPDAHTRTDDENKELTQTLEHQYQVGLEKKMTGQNRRHVGLGFAEPEEEVEQQPKNTHMRFDAGDKEDGSGESSDRRPDDDEKEGDQKRREARDGDARTGRDEARRDEGSRRRSGDTETRQSHRDEARDRKDRGRQTTSRPLEEERSKHDERKQRRRDELDESADRQKKKQKKSKRDDTDSDSD